MRAWQVHELGDFRDVLRLEDLPEPEPGPGQALVQVKAAGVNFPDLLVIAGKYQFKPPMPFTPGLEAAGVITRVSPDSRLAVGTRVIVSCAYGAFAEQLTAPEDHLYPVPDGMSDEHAAALFITYQTSYFGLAWRAQLQAGEWLLVHGGAGGVGTAAIQLGKALQARVIATAGDDAKLEVCKRAGADHVINYKTQDFAEEVKRITSGHGADVIYDPVGGDVFDASTKCIAFSGRLLVIGFASGRIPTLAMNRVLLKNISIVGVHWGLYRQHQPELIRRTHDILVRMYAEKQIEPIIYGQHRLDALPEALEALRDRQSYGKIVLNT